MQLPLNVSSVSTSFFGLTRLGIHLVLFLACTPTHSRVCVYARRIVLRVLCVPLLLFSLLSAKLKQSMLWFVQLFKVHVGDRVIPCTNWNVESHQNGSWLTAWDQARSCAHVLLPERSTWECDPPGERIEGSLERR